MYLKPLYSGFERKFDIKNLHTYLSLYRLSPKINLKSLEYKIDNCYILRFFKRKNYFLFPLLGCYQVYYLIFFDYLNCPNKDHLELYRLPDIYNYIILLLHHRGSQVYTFDDITFLYNWFWAKFHTQ